MKRINLPVGGIEIQVDVGVMLRPQGTGTIRSSLKSDADSQESEEQTRKRLEKNRAYDGVEFLILGHACAGINVESPAYRAGIESAITSVERRWR